MRPSSAPRWRGGCAASWGPASFWPWQPCRCSALPQPTPPGATPLPPWQSSWWGGRQPCPGRCPVGRPSASLSRHWGRRGPAAPPCSGQPQAGAPRAGVLRGGGGGRRPLQGSPLQGPLQLAPSPQRAQGSFQHPPPPLPSASPWRAPGAPSQPAPSSSSSCTFRARPCSWTCSALQRMAWSPRPRCPTMTRSAPLPSPQGGRALPPFSLQ